MASRGVNRANLPKSRAIAPRRAVRARILRDPLAESLSCPRTARVIFWRPHQEQIDPSWDRGTQALSQTFVHLHNHSQYSLLDGACRIPEMVGRVRELGMPAAAITDHGNLFGWIDFYREASSQGIKPILGIETYVAPGARTDRNSQKGERNNYHLILLAKNRTGYQNLIRLSSLAFLEGLYHKPRIDRDLLRRHGEGLIGLSACLQGEVNANLRQERYDAALDAARFYREVLDGFYLELQDHGIPDERATARRMCDLAREEGFPLVVTNDSHYLRREHAAAHDALLCIQTGRLQTDENRMRFETDQMYLKSAEEMASIFPDVPEAVANSIKIAEECNVSLEFGKLRLPHFPCPPEHETLNDYLDALCAKGLERRYPGAAEELRARLRYELDVIHRMNYAGYFLIVQDFISYARSQGIPVGPGRGSAAGSLVAYCLGITNIDPIRYSLVFERFLNPERISMPDIDVDFSDRGRAQVIRYVIEKYGAENVTQIITFGTMAARAVVRDVGRVKAIPYGDVDRIAKMVPQAPHITLEKALDQSPELRERYNADSQVKDLVETGRILEGLARHASTHAAGVVISPTPLIENVPLYRSSEGEVTTQWDMAACEAIGLLKMDFLGLRTLTVLQDCLEAIRQNHGATIDLESIPLDDPDVYALFAKGETVGIFQFESSGMTDYLRKLHPGSLEDLIAMNALYRPGPLGSGMVDDFIQRKQGAKAIRYEHPLLEPILKDTNGVIVYQEQVLQIASAMAGYSLGEADLLRRAMGKKKQEIMDEQAATFVERAVSRKIPADTAGKVFELMAHFAGYGFNKSHSAGYALVAYQTAWLKRHYPAEFLAASLTSEMSDKDRVMILQSEARRLGIRVLPPDANISEECFSVQDGSIRFGLEAVKGVGHGAVEAILESRREGPFRTLYDFCERIDPARVNRKCIENLVLAGALDSLGGHRAQQLETIGTAMEWASRVRKEKTMGQVSLFGGESGAEASPPHPPLTESPEWPAADLLRREKDALGFYVSGHPLEEFRRVLDGLGVVPLHLLETIRDNEPILAAGLPTLIRKSLDKRGQTIAFLTIEDFTGSTECLVFNDAYQQCGRSLNVETPILLKARVSTREDQKPKLRMEEAVPLIDLQSGGQLTLHLALPRTADDELLDALGRIFESHPGPSSVWVHIDHQTVEGVQMRLRGRKVTACAPLLGALEKQLGRLAVRLTVGEPRGSRSQEIFMLAGQR
jgi:DNA polymerase III subunit alpha